MSLPSFRMIPGLIKTAEMPPKLRLPRGDEYPPTVDAHGSLNEDGSRRPTTPDQEESEAFKYRVEFEEMLEKMKDVTSAMGYTIKKKSKSKKGQRKGTNNIIPMSVGPVSSDCEEVPSADVVRLQTGLPGMFVYGSRDPHVPKPRAKPKSSAKPSEQPSQDDVPESQKLSTASGGPSSSSRPHQSSRKKAQPLTDQGLIDAFHAESVQPMQEDWPPASMPRITSNLYDAWISDLPEAMRTRRSPLCYGTGRWRRQPFLLEPNDFVLREYRIHLMLPGADHHHIHFESTRDLMDKGATLAILAESDMYLQYNRSARDVSKVPAVCTKTEFKTWEFIPITLLRRRPVQIVFEWVFDRSGGYWSLPLRVSWSSRDHGPECPSYEHTSPSDVGECMPPCTRPNPTQAFKDSTTHQGTKRLKTGASHMEKHVSPNPPSGSLRTSKTWPSQALLASIPDPSPSDIVDVPEGDDDMDEREDDWS